jgi:hypothetical protein
MKDFDEQVDFDEQLLGWQWIIYAFVLLFGFLAMALLVVTGE